MSEISQPFKIFTETDGTPLENGFIYIGVPGLNPEISPVDVFFDEDLTITAARPIRTLGGYPSRNGSPGQLFIAPVDYSITVRDKQGRLVYSSLSSNGTGGDLSVVATVAAMAAGSFPDGATIDTQGYYAAGDGGGARYLVVTAVDFGGAPDEYGDHTLANGNVAVLEHSGVVNVRHFGAFHDETLFAAPIAAVDQAEFFDAAGAAGREVEVPEGDYKVAVPLANEAIWNMHPGCNIADAAGLTQPATGLYNTENFTGFVRIWAKRPQAGTGSVLNSKSSLRQGDPEPYEITKTGHADSTTAVTVGVGYNGGAGGHFAAHTENNPTTGALQNALSVYGIQDRDNTDAANISITSLYVEGIRYPNTYSNPCAEINSKNFGSTATVTALGNVANATWGMQFISGGQHPDEVSQGGALTFNPSSFALGVIADGVGTTRPGFDKGIMFFINSISGADKLAIESHVDHSFGWRAAGGALEARIGNSLHRLAYGNDNTAVNTSERVFWRYRGAPNARGVTLTGDYLGRTSYHGHQASTGGFAGGSTNALVTTEGIQDGAVSGANAAGKYSVRVNDGAGAMTGMDFLPARVRPTGDGVMDLGSGANRMNTIYAAVGTINTSDRRMKHEVEELSVAELAVAGRLRLLVRRYRLNTNPTFIHVGVIAQDVIDAFTAEGLNALDYALLDYDEDSDRYGVIYTELLAFVLAAI